jgi:hypothetical protein
MKRIALLVTLLVMLSVGVFASPVHPNNLGIGVLWGGNASSGNFHNNAALSLKLPALPVFWGVTLGGIGGEGISVGLQGDVYLLGSQLIPAVNLGWFLGLGAYGNILLGNDAAIAFGGRIPLGLTWQPVRFFELFGNFVGTVGTGLYTHGDGGLMGFRSAIGGELGIRAWL